MKEKKMYREIDGSEVRIINSIKEGKVYFTVIDASYNYIGNDIVEIELFTNEINKYFIEVK